MPQNDSKGNYEVLPACSPPNSLVHHLSVERNTHSAEEEPSILVGLRRGVDGDMTTGDHLGRVPNDKRG